MWKVKVVDGNPMGYAIVNSEDDVVGIFTNQIQTENVVKAHNDSITKIQEQLMEIPPVLPS